MSTQRQPGGGGAAAAGSSATRPLRVFLLANDGFSAGHVVRMVAVARALRRRSSARGIDARLVLATTSEASPFLDDDTFVVVRLPAPSRARRAGFGDAERRRIVRGTLDGILRAFAPDLVVCDTFPSGPHGELDGVDTGRAKRVLVRRAVVAKRARDTSGSPDPLSAGIEAIGLTVVADDPFAHDVSLPMPLVRVPPITLGEASDALPRAAAREALALDGAVRAYLVVAGGGGDGDAVGQARLLAERVAALAPGAVVVRAVGPLEGGARAKAVVFDREAGHDPDASSLAPPRLSRVRTLEATPLQPFLAAFDGAFSTAGYNSAHELAKAGLPAALFARPRPYDDQLERARRFASAKLAHVLDDLEEPSVATALSWIGSAHICPVEAGGADRAADALLDHAVGRRATDAPSATGASAR